MLVVLLQTRLQIRPIERVWCIMAQNAKSYKGVTLGSKSKK